MFQVSRITALVTDWSETGQALGLWQKHYKCTGPVTIDWCRGGLRIVLMYSRFNNDAQSRYRATEGEALTLYWAKDKADLSYIDAFDANHKTNEVGDSENFLAKSMSEEA